MAITPTQTRTIDPFADYQSNSTNKLTRTISRATNCLHGPHDIDITINDNTSVIASAGFCFKDDVYIQLQYPTTIDFTNVDSYFNVAPLGWTFPTDGNYYIALSYTYSKIKPAPVSKVGILRPDELGDIANPEYLFLKQVIVSGGIITEVRDVSTLNPNIKRVFSQTFVGLENTLPTFSQATDEGRLILVVDENEFYFGTNSAWVNFNTSHSVLDTQGFDIGEILYINDITGNVGRAISTSFDSLARSVVIQVGPPTGGGSIGKVSLFGRCVLKIENGITIAIDDKLYLSGTEAGSVTNVSPPSYQQFIGTAVSVGTGGVGDGTCEAWFVPNLKGGGGSGTGSLEDTMWRMMLEKSTYLNAYYDLFETENTLESVSGATYNFNESYWEGVNNDYFITPELISDMTSTMYRFYSYVDTDELFPIKIEYTVDGTSWIEIQNNISTLYLAGYTSLKLKVTWLGSGKIYSFGVFYNESMYQALSDTRMLEIHTAVINHTAPFNIVIPNNGVFTNDGKSLEIYRNGVRLMHGEHYTEINEFSVTMLVDINIGEKLMFVEHYGYIDSSVENYGRVSEILNGTLTVGDSYKLNGMDPGNASGNIPINNGILCVDLNADMLDGKTSGHYTNQIPISDSTVCIDLNADMIDGYHASQTPGANRIITADSEGKISVTGGWVRYYTTGDLVIPASGVAYSGSPFTHNLGSIPTMIQYFLKCVISAGGYTAGEIIPWSNLQLDSVGSVIYGVTPILTTTQLILRQNGSGGNQFFINPKTPASTVWGPDGYIINTGNSSSWRFIVRLWA